jgi:hypothetical protein
MTKTETVISDIYDAWRSQDLDRFATYLPNDFSHVVYIPTEVHPLGGVCNGKQAVLARLGLIAAEGADPAAICAPPAISHSVDPDRALTGAYDAAYQCYRALYPAVKKATVG